MIKFDRFTLDNGLKVFVIKDKNTPIVAINLLYNIGARDENPEKTGFAHLFEHLMFGGSSNISDFDGPLQKVGGDNNAFTTNDITNYYMTLPKENIETGFWLESDRMLSLAFSDKNLETQKNVVIEEFKQRYYNQPYGDVWLYLRPLAYKKHPYRWATIGKDIKHIEDADMKDVKDFFYKFYAPNNAILSIAGNVELDDIKKLAKKWFGDIEKRNVPERLLPKEPQQNEERKLTIKSNVPFDAIYKVYHMCDRRNKDYYATDLVSDILANGDSSRLYQRLTKEKELFSSIDAYILGNIDNGLFVIYGKLFEGVSMEKAEEAIEEELQLLNNEFVSEYELSKIKNRVESTLVFSEISALNKAINLSLYELLGDANMINKEAEKYNAVTVDDINRISKQIFKKTNCSTLYYMSKQQDD